MPIYEFYCAGCHRVFNFLSRGIDTGRRPNCPRCDRKRLPRQASAFAVSTGRRGTHDAAPGQLDVDESAVERSVASLARGAERIDENDTRAISRLMSGFYQGSGMPMGDGMREAVQRMAAGEDVERIEADLGEALDAEDPAPSRRGLHPPVVDDELFEF